MNDFTKLELQYICKLVYFSDESFDSPLHLYDGLYEKIRSMIDNYSCNHESQTPNSPGIVHMCVKCFEEFVL